MKSVQNNKLW